MNAGGMAEVGVGASVGLATRRCCMDELVAGAEVGCRLVACCGCSCGEFAKLGVGPPCFMYT